MYKRFIMLLGVFLGSYVPTGAQTPFPRIVPAQVRVAPIVMVRTVPAPFLFPSFPLSESPENPLPISVTCSWELTSVTRAWRVFRRCARPRLCFSHSRACPSCNSGADVCGWTALRAPLTCRTCNLVLQPLAVCWTIVLSDKVIRAGRVRSVSAAST